VSLNKTPPQVPKSQHSPNGSPFCPRTAPCRPPPSSKST